jgi:hypothetical protein
MKPKVITHTPGKPPADAAGAPALAEVIAAGAAPAGVPGSGPVVGQGMTRVEARVEARVVARSVVPSQGPAASLTAITSAVPGGAPSPTTVAPQPHPLPGPGAALHPLPGARTAPQSVVPGTIRRGVDVSSAQLAQRFPAATPEALQQAERLLQGTIVDTLSATQAARWGDEAQQRYGALVDASLQITQAATLQTSLRHVARLHALLQAMADQWLVPAKSPLLFWRSSASPAELLQASQGEVAQLRQHLADALPALRGLQAELQGIAGELAPLAVRLEALSLAAHYLADTLADNLAAQPGSDADPRAYALLQRASALAQTVLHIHGGLQVRQGSQHSLDGLIHRIQDTVLMALPAWMEKVALATQARQLNDTERYALAQQLQGLMGQLHSS